MSRQDDERFRIRPGAPKHRSPRFITRVLGEVHKAGTTVGLKAGAGVIPAARSGKRPGARLGRGHVAAKLMPASLGATARRVTIKSRLVNLKHAGAASIGRHLRYIQREGVARDSGATQAYGPTTDDADVETFEQRGLKDRHQFRFIIAPEDAEALGDLHAYTRALMTRMEADLLGTRLDWVAVDHWDTDNAHTHLVLRGRDDVGQDLIIAGDYIAHGMRHRASELALERLGPRTEVEIEHSLRREVEQERMTSLDRVLQQAQVDEYIRVDRLGDPGAHAPPQRVLLGRLHRLRDLGLASEVERGAWQLRPDAEAVLRAMGERGDIVRTMQRAMKGVSRELAVTHADAIQPTIVGRIAGKGLIDELHDRGYLVVDGVDGRAHYVPLPAHAELASFPVGAIIEAHGARDRTADQAVVAQRRQGLYHVDTHRAWLYEDRTRCAGRDPDEVIATHVRRLEALRRSGHVQRVVDGVWRVPEDLVQRGREHDARELGDVAVHLRSHLPLDRQTRVIGATWLDQQLVTGASGVTDRGFGAEVRRALADRAEFLIDQGFAVRRGARVTLMRDVLAELRGRELAATARQLAGETVSTYRPPIDGQRVSGVYRRSLQLASGRFAMLDDGHSFSLVPWKPVIEPRLGKTLSAIVRGSSVSWDVGRTRDLGIG